MRGGEMRDSVTPTASKLEGGAKRAHKTVFFDIGRVYVPGQVCVCNISLAYKSASFRYFRVSIKIRMCVVYVMCVKLAYHLSPYQEKSGVPFASNRVL